MQLGADG